VSSLASLYTSATVLGAESGKNPPATIDGVLASMSGAWIAHIAAHGTFRADSPLFSSLRLDEGPLFVHDLDRLRRPPHRVVLSACDTGVAAPVGADELLGLVSALLRVGAAGVLACVVPVNDQAAVPFMLTVHQALADGKPMPEAALEGRRSAVGDPLAAATAASFSVWGA
jgi:CHAT domain-containing protein